jgi:16S rRNA (adenine1518-N6/adenine1519-N6)-dimethyltransferase
LAEKRPIVTPFSRKRFGQHFLEPAWVEKLVRVIDPQPDQTFIEIGPGRGALTRPLAARSSGVIAYEIDRDLARALRDEAIPNVTIVEGDFLDQSLPLSLPTPEYRVPSTEYPVPSTPLRVAANLPYNAASPILFALLAMRHAGLPVADATVMLQREVADRLLAEPGTPEYGVLSVLIRHRANVTRLLNLPAGAFRPAPKVLSSVVQLRFHDPDPPVKDLDRLGQLVRAVFTRRRKTMANALRALDQGRAKLPLWLDGGRRPETLSVAEFARLADELTT